MNGNRSKSAFFEGVGHFECRFQREGASPTNHCWCQKTRVIGLSCDTIITAVHHLVLSQYTCLTDRRADGRTDRQTELRQQHCALHYIPKGKTVQPKSVFNLFTRYSNCVEMLALFSASFVYFTN